MAKTDTLKDIVSKKKERIALAKQALPEETLKERVKALPPARPFLAAINKPKAISLIAEIKKQSPSHGLIRPDFSPAAIAAVYQEAGAQAISVLTEEDFFSGSPAYIQEVKNAASMPVLRKDFILEPYQVYESRYYGADAILLIADLLSKDALAEMILLADSLGLACLVEVHNEKELKKVAGLKIVPPGEPDRDALKRKKPAPVDFAIGINNRDLHTLEVDLKTTERLYPLVPKGRIVVVESGLERSNDILFLKVLGVNAILVGGSILKAGDMKEKILDLMGW